MTVPRGQHAPLDEARRAIAGPLTARQFFDAFLRVSVDGRLTPMVLHVEQARALDAWDLIDPATGLPRYSELLLSWIKKAGKTATVAGLGLHELVAGSEPDREIILASSGLLQSRDVTFAAIVRFIRRHPWLSKHVRCLTTELVYQQTVVDPRTGGRHRQDHTLKAVPTKDARSLHGTNATLVILDELWAQSDYEVIEALAASPARRVSRTLYSSYAGLRHQRREGVPLFDLLQRWQSGEDKGLFVSHLSGPDAWRQIPWITERFIEGQRRKFAAVPSKFKRLWQNEWAAGDEGTFLSSEEIRDAIDHDLVEPDTLPAGECYGGLDLALSHDWAAFVITRVDERGRLVLVAIRFWRGTRQKPVSLMLVEDEVARLAARFNLQRLTADQWQAQLLSERLRLRGVRDVRAVAITPALLDKFATSLKGLFSSRLIRIPSHPELIEQLENLRGVEQRRRDLVKFDSGKGSGAAGHDDLVFALMLSADMQERAIGRAVLPANFRECYRAASVPNFNPGSCFLLGGGYTPSGDVSCKACPGYQYVRQAYQDHVGRGGERMDVRSFRRLYVQGNDFTGRWAANQWADAMGI